MFDTFMGGLPTFPSIPSMFRFENGVLRVTLPKRPETGGGERKIEIKKS